MDTPEVCDGDGDDQIPLPGFRFHPTDEELVSFYLRRKVDKRPISLELIKQIDIYKHNPWDLPYASSNVGDKEWYFFCKRGRKYKNSIRPNRVTGSGFWKATGIDKPVYSNGGEGNECIGLKKTLVYYRGSAGKGTKTDWMMHEFRLPPPPHNQKHQPNSKNFAEEAEIWTLCRIFKRNVSCRRSSYGTTTTATSNWNNKQTPTKNDTKIICNKYNDDEQQQQQQPPADKSSSGEISYINFSCESMIIQNNNNNYNIDHEKKPIILPNYPNNNNNNNNSNYYYNNNNNYNQYSISSSMAPSPIASFPTTNQQLDVNDFFTNSNWDELRSMVDMF